MEIGQLYSFVLLLVLVGLILGVGLIVLQKFASTTGVIGDAQGAINKTITAISDIPNSWMSLIVTIAVLSIIIVLVLGAFGGMGKKR